MTPQLSDDSFFRLAIVDSKPQNGGGMIFTIAVLCCKFTHYIERSSEDFRNFTEGLRMQGTPHASTMNAHTNGNHRY
jgi:hypothetical protein